MMVELKSLKPNPFRDFDVDPIDKERVMQLRDSIKEDGFWGGVVCRQLKRGGDIEIAAGHHRVEAAIKAGISSADVFVSKEMDDATMIRIYARENATQRGNSGTAQTGSVASAVKFLATAILSEMVSSTCVRNHDLAKLRGNLASERGIGQPLIVAFLKDVPGINASSVNQQLAALKQSGEYDRLIRDVIAELRSEKITGEVEQLIERIEARTGKKEPIFNLRGVAEYFENPKQLEAFRIAVTSEIGQKRISFDGQAKLAKKIASQTERITAAGITDEVSTVIHQAAAVQNAITLEEADKRTDAHWKLKMEGYQDEFSRGIGVCLRAMIAMRDAITKRPANETFLQTAQFRDDMKAAERIVAIGKKLGF